MIVGLVLTLLTGWLPFDPIFAILVAFNILWSVRELIRRSGASGLMDMADPERTSRVQAAIEPLCRDLGFAHHGLRVRHTGYRTLVEVHLLFPFAVTLGDAHRRATVLEQHRREGPRRGGRGRHAPRIAWKTTPPSTATPTSGRSPLSYGTVPSLRICHSAGTLEESGPVHRSNDFVTGLTERRPAVRRSPTGSADGAALASVLLMTRLAQRARRGQHGLAARLLLSEVRGLRKHSRPTAVAWWPPRRRLRERRV